MTVLFVSPLSPQPTTLFLHIDPQIQDSVDIGDVALLSLLDKPRNVFRQAANLLNKVPGKLNII